MPEVPQRGGRPRVLLIAYHFPPIQGSTGVTRTLAFSKYLTEAGWDVAVLTARESAYESVRKENESLIPPGVTVERGWALDTRRHLSLSGRYPRFLALPDRWQTWIAGAYLKGRAKIRQWAPDVIMSTYPIASAHAIGFLLSRATGIPWVAEFRDPMLQANYPADPWERKAFSAIEKRVFAHAARVVVTTEGCRRFYQDRYPDAAHRLSVISNGYDPEMFAALGLQRPHSSPDRLVLLHSGVLYPYERNPEAFFQAVCDLADEGFFQSNPAEFRFRASGNETTYQEAVTRLGIDSLVKFLPRTDYRSALAEMIEVDALMVFQADNCNDQIPAKVYEYMYAGRPILGLADPEGDTGRLLETAGVPAVAKLESRDDVKRALRSLISELRSGQAYVVPKDVASQYSRKVLTRDLQELLGQAAHDCRDDGRIRQGG